MSKAQPLNTLFHCSYSMHYHLVLVTKYRRRCITQEMAEFLAVQYNRLLQQWGCKLVEVNGEADHMHLLISASPKILPAKMVNMLKTSTSRMVRNRFSGHLARYYWKPVFYSRSYCLVTCGGAPLDIVKQYLENQAGFT